MATHPIKDDGRYTIDREFCGYPQRRYVARFCGEWIGQDQYHSGAIMLCIAHYDAREAKLKRGIVTDATRASERGAFNGNWRYSCCRSWRELVRFRIECHAEQPVGSMPLHTRIY